MKKSSFVKSGLLFTTPQKWTFLGHMTTLVEVENSSWEHGCTCTLTRGRSTGKMKAQKTVQYRAVPIRGVSPGCVGNGEYIEAVCIIHPLAYIMLGLPQISTSRTVLYRKVLNRTVRPFWCNWRTVTGIHFLPLLKLIRKKVSQRFLSSTLIYIGNMTNIRNNADAPHEKERRWLTITIMAASRMNAVLLSGCRQKHDQTVASCTTLALPACRPCPWSWLCFADGAAAMRKRRTISPVETKKGR
jgi:hypothetical protein